MDESLHSAEQLRVSRILLYDRTHNSYDKSYSFHLYDWKKHRKGMTVNSRYNSKFASLQSFVISRCMTVPRLPYPILQSTTAFTRDAQIPGGWSPWRPSVGTGKHWCNATDNGKTKYRGKTCPSATLPITKPHMDRPGNEPGHPR
jgi:hypothetical protein